MAEAYVYKRYWIIVSGGSRPHHQAYKRYWIFVSGGSHHAYKRYWIIIIIVGEGKNGGGGGGTVIFFSFLHTLLIYSKLLPPPPFNLTRNLGGRWSDEEIMRLEELCSDPKNRVGGKKCQLKKMTSYCFGTTVLEQKAVVRQMIV